MSSVKSVDSDRKKIVIVGAKPGYASSYIGLLEDIYKDKYDLVFLQYEGDMDLQGINVDYFLLDEAPQLDRNLKKLQNMELEPSVMIPDMFEYVKESQSLRNQNRGYWQKGRW